MSIVVKRINRQVQVVRVGRRGLQGGPGPTGPKGDPGTTDYNELENLPDLTLKADKATTYTKTEVDTALTGKANTVHTHTASDITDFNPSVSSNADVSANTAARHTHANKAILDATSASFTTADETKLDGIESGAQVNTVTSVSGKTGVVTLDKTDVGLSNVDNTSDADKPVSTAQQTALNAKSDLNHNHDTRYANATYATMAKTEFATIPSSYGFLGQKLSNGMAENDLVIYGKSTQASVPTPDVPVPIVSTTGNVTVTSTSGATTSTSTLPLSTTQLRSLPNGVSDRIYKDGATWKLEQNIGGYTITPGMVTDFSATRWAIPSVFINKTDVGMASGFASNSVMSNKYKNATNTTTDKAVASNLVSFYVGFLDVGFTDLATARALILEHPSAHS